MKTRQMITVGVAVLGVAVLAGGVAHRVVAQGGSTADRDIVRSVIRVGGMHIGASVREVTQADATAAKIASASGAYVQAVTDLSPAAAAGLKAGDIVMTFDGERVRSANHLVRLVSESPEGRAVEAVVQRAGQRVVLQITPESGRTSAAQPFMAPDLSRLEERLAELPQRIQPLVPEVPLGAGRLGATVQELTGQLAGYFGVTDGVLVTAVTSGSAAATAGLKAGDVITKVDGTAVQTAAGLRRGVAQASSGVTLTVTRDRKEMTLKVPVTTAGPRSRTMT